jgi:hypothetical protein
VDSGCDHRRNRVGLPVVLPDDALQGKEAQTWEDVGDIEFEWRVGSIECIAYVVGSSVSLLARDIRQPFRSI